MFGFELTSGLCIMLFTFVTGTFYNLCNIYHGYVEAKNKSLALKCLIPYFQVYLLIFLASYSRFYKDAALLFFVGLGLFQTYVAGLLNISSTAKLEFQYLYWEPVAYAGILYLDFSGTIASS